jgi:hypothetical protein
MRKHHGLVPVSLAMGAFALLTLVLAPASVAAAGSKVAPRVPLAGVKVIGWGFSYPEAVSSDGTHVWVTNYFGNSTPSNRSNS